MIAKRATKKYFYEKEIGNSFASFWDEVHDKAFCALCRRDIRKICLLFSLTAPRGNFTIIIDNDVNGVMEEIVGFTIFFFKFVWHLCF